MGTPGRQQWLLSCPACPARLPGEFTGGLRTSEDLAVRMPKPSNWHLPPEREMMVNKTPTDWLKPGDLVDDSMHTTQHITTYTWSTQPRSKALEPDYDHQIRMEY